MTIRQVVAPGATVEVTGHAVGEGHRTGEILEVLGDRAHPHYRVRWEDGRETTLFPGSDVRVRFSESALRNCHGFTVDSADGHLGSVVHVRKARDGRLELHVAASEGIVRIPVDRIRHFDPNEKRIAVI